MADTSAAIVQEALDWLDKNHLTENEFIDVPVPQHQEEVAEVIQIIPSTCISGLLLEQVVGSKSRPWKPLARSPSCIRFSHRSRRTCWQL